MTTLHILIQHDVIEDVCYVELDFNVSELGVAQAYFQMLCTRDDNTNVALMLKDKNGLPELLCNKEEFRKAVTENHLKQSLSFPPVILRAAPGGNA